MYHLKYRTKCFLVCILVLLFATTVYAFGGGHSGSKSTSFKNGVDAIGIYFGGDKPVDIEIVEEETDPYVKPKRRRITNPCPGAVSADGNLVGYDACGRCAPGYEECGAKCCAEGHTCQTSESGEPMCCDEDGNCCPNSVAYDQNTGACCSASAGSYTDSGCCQGGLEDTVIDGITVCCNAGEEAFCTQFENGKCVAGACCDTAADGKTIRWSRNEIEPDECETTQKCDAAHVQDELGRCFNCAPGYHPGPYQRRCLFCPLRCIKDAEDTRCWRGWPAACDEDECEEMAENGEHVTYDSAAGKCVCAEGYMGYACDKCADRYTRNANGECVFDEWCAGSKQFYCPERDSDGSCLIYACCVVSETPMCIALNEDGTCADMDCCEGAVLKGQGDYGLDKCVAACPKGGYSDGMVCCRDGLTSTYRKVRIGNGYAWKWGDYTAVAGSCVEQESTRWYIDDDSAGDTYWFEYKRYYGEDSDNPISRSYPYLSAGSWAVVYDPNDEEHPYTVYDYYRDDEGALHTIKWYPASLEEVENTPVKKPSQTSLLEHLFGVKSAFAGTRAGTNSSAWGDFWAWIGDTCPYDGKHFLERIEGICCPRGTFRVDANGNCCPLGVGAVDDKGVCCSSGVRITDAQGQCCPPNVYDLDDEGNCCPERFHNSAGKCCPPDYNNIDGTCCPPRVFHVDHTGECCPPSAVVNEDGDCCPEGTQAIDSDGNCCPPGVRSVDGDGNCCPPQAGLDADGNCCPEGWSPPSDGGYSGCCPKNSHSVYRENMVNCCSSGVELLDKDGYCCEVNATTLDKDGNCCPPRTDVDADGNCCPEDRQYNVDGVCCELGVETLDKDGNCCPRRTGVDDDGNCCPEGTYYSNGACCPFNTVAVWDGDVYNCCSDPNASLDANGECCPSEYVLDVNNNCCVLVDENGECCQNEIYYTFPVVGLMTSPYESYDWKCCEDEVTAVDSDGNCCQPGQKLVDSETTKLVYYVDGKYSGWRLDTVVYHICCDSDVFIADKRGNCCAPGVTAVDEDGNCCPEGFHNSDGKCCPAEKHNVDGVCCPNDVYAVDKNDRCCAPEVRKVDGNGNCCAPGVWAVDKDGNCCGENEHVVAGVCCADNDDVLFDGQCCSRDRIAVEDGVWTCCEKGQHSVYVSPGERICCQSDDDSQKCCEAAHRTWINDMCCDGANQSAECCTAAGGYYLLYSHSCCTDPGQSQECCQAAGKNWLDGICCGEDEHVDDGICCESDKHNIDGICCASNVNITYTDGNGDRQCCETENDAPECCTVAWAQAEGRCCDIDEYAINGICCDIGIDTTYTGSDEKEHCCGSVNDAPACCPQGRAWATGGTGECCETDQHVVDGICCGPGENATYESSGTRKCCTWVDAFIEQECCEATEGYFWDDGECCEEGKHNAGGVCCDTADTPIYTDSDGTKQCCLSEDDAPECCPQGREWASVAKECCEPGQYDSNGICCDQGQYNSNGICCDQGKYNDNGICCASDRHNDDGICCAEGEHNDGGICCAEGLHNAGGECVHECPTGETPYCADVERNPGESCQEMACCAGTVSSALFNQVCCLNGSSAYCTEYYGGECDFKACCDGEILTAEEGDTSDLCCPKGTGTPYWAVRGKYHYQDEGACCASGNVFSGAGENGADVCCAKDVEAVDKDGNCCQVGEIRGADGECTVDPYAELEDSGKKGRSLSRNCSEDSPGYASVDGRCCEAGEELIEENCCPAGSTAFSPATGCCTANQTQHMVDGLLVCCDAGQTPVCTQHDSSGETCLLASCN